MPSIGATATSGGPGISHWDIPPMFAATRVACFVSLPRRSSICTVSSGSSLRASSTSFLPGPDWSSSSAFTAASDVPLNFVMMSPTLRPALSAGPPGVTPSILAPILSVSGLASVLTTTPIRPRWSLIMNARTRGGRGGAGRAFPGAPGRDPFDLGADLVGLRARIGLDHHADPAAVVAHHERPDARRARRARRALRREPDRGAGERRCDDDPVPLHVKYPSGALEPHVRGTRHADAHELLHEIHPLLPQVDEVSGVSLGLRGAQLCQLAVDDGNAVFQGGRERRGAAARHPSVRIVTPQLLLQRRRLLLHAGELGGVDRLRPERPEQEEPGERRSRGEPRDAPPLAARAPLVQHGVPHRGPAVPRRPPRRQRLQPRDALVQRLELRPARRAPRHVLPGGARG